MTEVMIEVMVEVIVEVIIEVMVEDRTEDRSAKVLNLPVIMGNHSPLRFASLLSGTRVSNANSMGTQPNKPPEPHR